MEHSGKLRTLRGALDELALRLTGTPEKTQTNTAPKPEKTTLSPPEGAAKEEPPPQKEPSPPL